MNKQIVMSAKMPVISIKKLLKEVGDHLSMVGQWRDRLTEGYTTNVTKYLLTSECLLNLVEEFDCGSHGGFGGGQPANQNIAERWDWLCTKYGLSYDKVKNYGWKRKEILTLFEVKDE